MHTTYGTTPYFAVEPIKSEAVISRVTWTRVKVLGGSTYLTSVLLYDEYGRVIQTKTTNHLGGIDISSNQYSWNG